MMECVKDKSHPAANFGWGNLVSLTAGGKDTLYDDVKKFHGDFYSADRMCVVL